MATLATARSEPRRKWRRFQVTVSSSSSSGRAQRTMRAAPLLGNGRSESTAQDRIARLTGLILDPDTPVHPVPERSSARLRCRGARRPFRALDPAVDGVAQVGAVL